MNFRIKNNCKFVAGLVINTVNFFRTRHICLAGQPEHWEYRAFGVIDDAEIGQPSDIAEIVFGG